MMGERAKISQPYRVDNFEPQASQWLSDTGDIFHFCQSEIVAFLQWGQANFFNILLCPVARVRVPRLRECLEIVTEPWKNPGLVPAGVLPGTLRTLLFTAIVGSNDWHSKRKQ
jgi:hypothetical protein